MQLAQGQNARQRRRFLLVSRLPAAEIPLGSTPLLDAETGDEVSNEDIIKGYQIDKDRYLEVTKDELENIALESTRTIEIDEFVPRSEIDDLYLVRPYYIVPDGKVGHDAFAVIRLGDSITSATRIRFSVHTGSEA